MKQYVLTVVIKVIGQRIVHILKRIKGNQINIFEEMYHVIIKFVLKVKIEKQKEEEENYM